MQIDVRWWPQDTSQVERLKHLCARLGTAVAFAKNEDDGESAGFGAKTKTFFFVVEFSDDFEHERSTSGVTTRRGCP